MSQQAINSKYETDGRTLEDAANGKSAPAKFGELVVGVRVDAVPEVEAKRLAAEGQFHPLTIDPSGFLRVTLPDGIKVKTEELEVLRAIRELLIELRDLLMKIA